MSYSKLSSFYYLKKVMTAIIFYDVDSSHRKDLSLFSSYPPHNRLLLRVSVLIVAFPLSLVAWLLIQALSFRFKVSIYVLKTFRPSGAGTYLNMIEPLCRKLQQDNNDRNFKILIDSGDKVSDVLIRSYEPHFNLYLDDRRKFVRLISYLIPKYGINKQVINTNDKYLSDWTHQRSKNYANLSNKIPTDLSNIGIHKNNFVLFVHPSMEYYKKMLPAETLINVQNRFVDLSTYKTALDKVSLNHLKIIRVGIEVDEMPITFKSTPIIDYTGEIRNEESELWLYENCKFLISVANGAFWFARRFDRPTIITNSYALPFGYFSTLYTPKTFRSTETGNLLSFAEMLKIRHDPNFLQNQFMKERKLELVPNSSSTIADAVGELLDLSNGKRTTSPEDVELVKRYNSILASFNIPIVEKMTLPAISFLRVYSHLL